MYSYTFFTIGLVVPLVLALPKAKPAPVTVAAPAPAFLPQSRQIDTGNGGTEGTETNVATGIVDGIIGAVLNSGSLVSDLPTALLSNTADIVGVVDAIKQAISNGTIQGTGVPAVYQQLFKAIRPTATPTSVEQARDMAASCYGVTKPDESPAPSQDLIANALTAVLNGFTSSDLQALIQSTNALADSSQNSNPAVPAKKKFYNAVAGNAPFSVSESDLRAAIYFPPAFTWGKKQPVLMNPGTGTTGVLALSANIGKLLSQGDIADPVYLNVPNNLLNDIQINAEYVAYAIQYLNIMTKRKIGIVSWSQGSINTQWSLKYWPSTRKQVTDHIVASGDYHGTILFNVFCPGLAAGNAIGCTPAFNQQTYQSNFIQTLRANDGDSAYVPTTTVYSLTDEIVQPQVGTAASSYLKDVRNVGVSNTFLQVACAGQPAGTLYTHEGVLYNPVMYALVVDALQNKGPGKFSRVTNACQDIVAPGLTLADVIETEATIPYVVLADISYEPKALTEPPI